MYKELFDANGHLTDEALKELANGTLDELNRLEAAEHLSFCDECLVRYTNLLTDDTLMTPDKPLVPKQQIREKGIQIILHRYLPAAMAACFALALWGAGVFTTLASPQSLESRYKETEAKISFERKADEVKSNINSAILQAIDTLTFQNTKPHN